VNSSAKQVIEEAIDALYPFADKTLWEDVGGDKSEHAMEMWIEPQWIRNARKTIKKLHQLLNGGAQ
jgi:hypothetical protein